MKKKKTEASKNPDLSAFDSKMRSMAKNGAFDNAINESLERSFNEIEPTSLSPKELKQFHHTVQNASVERSILDYRKSTPIRVLPFGRFLQLIRDRCDISKIDVARVLRKDLIFIEKIENGQTNPLHLKADDVVDIMQLFRMTITELKNTITAFLSLSDSKRCNISAIARSTLKSGENGQEDKLGLAMDAALQAIVAKRGGDRISNMKINPDYIKKILKILKERKEHGLLE